MAEIWPRLKTKLSGNRKRKSGRSTKSKANPYSSLGLEKFATLLEGIQGKNGASLVERTASSLSAARSISRSAQEWTAATLVRSASRRSSSEPKLAAFEALAPTKVENLEKVVKNSSRDVLKSSKDMVNSSKDVEERQPQEASSSGLVGIGSLPERRTSSRCQLRNKSKSAFVVLLAMGTFISTQFDKVAAVLTFSAVVQVWHKGKMSARLMFSSVALYFFTPLRSYLVTRIPTRLNLLPRNSNVISATEEESRNSEIVIFQPDSSLGFPADSAAEESPILLPIPEICSSTLVPKSTGVSSTSRRLAKKISSRLKKLKMFRSSSSSSSSVSEGPHYFDATSTPSSPDRRRMCPFSKRTKSADVVTELEDSSSSRKCIVMRRQRSSDSMECKRSKLSRRLSSETLEEYNLSESSAPSSLHGKSASEDIGSASSSRDVVSWPILGLLITLLFLLVGRFPAIMATSLFFVVASSAHHTRGRDNNRALEAARKLQRSPQRWTSPLRR